MSVEHAEQVVRAMRREIALACDEAGTITWLDDAAQRLLNVAVGMPFVHCAAPGSGEKLTEMLASARTKNVERWELALIVRSKPATISFTARAIETGGVALVGSLVTEDYLSALGEMQGTMGEITRLHRETAEQKAELQRRHDETLRLYRELRDSTRGVVALHAELDQKSDSLHRMTESRDRVVANVSHEFRTPVNSILGLTNLLLSGADGALNDEQQKQIGFIRKSAEALSTLTNDLLDISKLESGRLTLRSTRFEVSELFGALRGMIQPLDLNPAVQLVFEDCDNITLETDEAKLAQILRNIIVNALKFTERGEVRVGCHVLPNARIAFTVRDTGIGIAADDVDRIFEEFVQIEGPMQARTKGTGLGLPLSRRLADLLGGECEVESRLGQGSTFTVTVPRVHPDVKEMAALSERSAVIDPMRSPILVVEDDRQTLFLYEKYLQGSGFQVVPVRTVEEARKALDRLRPAAIVLDVMLEGESTWRFLSELKSNPETRDIPALIVTVTDREQKARALGADEFFIKPLDRTWFLNKLRSLAVHSTIEKVLVIDDDEVSRYLIRKFLAGSPYRVLEASSGDEGLVIARRELPHVIVLDFVMPEMSAFEVLDELKKDPTTRKIPVIINTSQQLGPDERARLQADTAAILSKQSLSREVAIGRIRDALMQVGAHPNVRGPV